MPVLRFYPQGAKGKDGWTAVIDQFHTFRLGRFPGPFRLHTMPDQMIGHLEHVYDVHVGLAKRVFKTLQNHGSAMLILENRQDSASVQN
jgi:hypothetical protein